MLGVYLTTFLAATGTSGFTSTLTFGDGMHHIWHGLGHAMVF